MKKYYKPRTINTGKNIPKIMTIILIICIITVLIIDFIKSFFLTS